MSLAEIYGTGRANLPGSVVERELQESLSRMLGELLRFSSSARLLPLIPPHLRDAHRVNEIAPVATKKPPAAETSANFNIWEDWTENNQNFRINMHPQADEDDVDLTAMGF